MYFKSSRWRRRPFVGGELLSFFFPPFTCPLKIKLGKFFNFPTEMFRPRKKLVVKTVVAGFVIKLRGKLDNIYPDWNRYMMTQQLLQLPQLYRMHFQFVFYRMLSVYFQSTDIQQQTTTITKKKWKETWWILFYHPLVFVEHSLCRPVLMDPGKIVDWLNDIISWNLFFFSSTFSGLSFPFDVLKQNTSRRLVLGWMPSGLTAIRSKPFGWPSPSSGRWSRDNCRASSDG